MYTRTQILLDPQTKADLAFISEMTNESMSSLVRRFVAEKVKVEKRFQTRKKIKTKKVSGIQSLLDLAKKAGQLDKKYGSEEDPTDGSINLDHYLYGAPKKKNA